MTPKFYLKNAYECELGSLHTTTNRKDFHLRLQNQHPHRKGQFAEEHHKGQLHSWGRASAATWGHDAGKCHKGGDRLGQ